MNLIKIFSEISQRMRKLKEDFREIRHKIQLSIFGLIIYDFIKKNIYFSSLFFNEIYFLKFLLGG